MSIEVPIPVYTTFHIGSFWFILRRAVRRIQVMVLNCLTSCPRLPETEFLPFVPHLVLILRTGLLWFNCEDSVKNPQFLQQLSNSRCHLRKPMSNLPPNPNEQLGGARGCIHQLHHIDMGQWNSPLQPWTGCHSIRIWFRICLHKLWAFLWWGPFGYRRWSVWTRCTSFGPSHGLRSPVWGRLDRYRLRRIG